MGVELVYLNLFKKRKLPLFRKLGEELVYRNSHPVSVILMNSRIYLKSYYEKEKNGRIPDYLGGQENVLWEGDLDLGRDARKLLDICKEIGETLVITTAFGKYVLEIEKTATKEWLTKISIDVRRQRIEEIKKRKKDALRRMH